MKKTAKATGKDKKSGQQKLGKWILHLMDELKKASVIWMQSIINSTGSTLKFTKIHNTCNLILFYISQEVFRVGIIPVLQTKSHCFLEIHQKGNSDVKKGIKLKRLL